jgi:hypothetical protein
LNGGRISGFVRLPVMLLPLARLNGFHFWHWLIGGWRFF